MAKREAVFPADQHALYDQHRYSAAIRSGDLLFVSGQVGSLADGSAEPDFQGQVRLAFANLKATLVAGGCGLDDIVDVLLDSRFAALADPTRRAILARLAVGEATVSDLAQPFTISQPAISKHLKVLERAGLIEKGRAAQSRPRRLNVAALNETTDWLRRIDALWRDSFDRLDAFLIANPGNAKPNEG